MLPEKKCITCPLAGAESHGTAVFYTAYMILPYVNAHLFILHSPLGTIKIWDHKILYWTMLNYQCQNKKDMFQYSVTSLSSLVSCLLFFLLFPPISPWYLNVKGWWRQSTWCFPFPSQKFLYQNIQSRCLVGIRSESSFGALCHTGILRFYCCYYWG